MPCLATLRRLAALVFVLTAAPSWAQPFTVPAPLGPPASAAALGSGPSVAVPDIEALIGRSFLFINHELAPADFGTVLPILAQQGPGATYDFSGVPFQVTDTTYVSIVIPDGQPGAQAFPSATFAIRLGTTPGGDEDGVRFYEIGAGPPDAGIVVFWLGFAGGGLPFPITFQPAPAETPLPLQLSVVSGSTFVFQSPVGPLAQQTTAYAISGDGTLALGGTSGPALRYDIYSAVSAPQLPVPLQQPMVKFQATAGAVYATTEVDVHFLTLGGPIARVSAIVAQEMIVTAAPAPEPPSVRIARVAPNPAAGAAEALVETTGGEMRLSVLDALGREVVIVAEGARAAGRHAVALPLAGLAPGVYTLRVVSGAHAATQRFTVAR